MTTEPGTKGNLPELELAHDPGVENATSLSLLTDGRLRHRRHFPARRAEHTLSSPGNGPVRSRFAGA